MSTLADRPSEPVRDPPQLDDLGVLRHNGRWLSLSPVQEAIMRCLIGRYGRPVGRAEVAAAVWAHRAPDLHAINVHIHRLRPRLKELGLVVHTLRGRGFMLEELHA